MFRRLWTGLPDTPKFPADLEKLGYFVNDDSEIRNIKDPKYYFKYFIDRNMYYNDSQRFSFSTAIQKIVLERLAALGVRPIRLPLGAREDEPHVLVLATDDLATADRVHLFIGETAQDLGILAHRVVGCGGGIEQGSILSMVRKVRDPDAVNENGEKVGPPAILIANPGELFWWPDAHRSLSLPSVEGMPRPSAAHLSPRKFPENTIPGHETANAHVANVFHDLLTRPSTENNQGITVPRITAIAIAGGADAIETFLDHPDRWQRWGPHMDSLVLLGGLYEQHHVQTDAFRTFLRQRARAYIASEAAVDTPIASPDGNEQAARATKFGCPVHSAGTCWLTELMFIEAQDKILAWGRMVAADRAYINPNIDITYAETILGKEDTTWANFEEEDAPSWGEGGDETMIDAGENKENEGVSGPALGDADKVMKNGKGELNGAEDANNEEAGTVEEIKEKLEDVTLEEK
ncbi:hypothetical protein SEUCBS139899_001484 [Sporothrix eucalyptigena]|uniref:Arb2 domain-containing protein n=1 Tax=Sporothrix eucalyptigena TaxID=1812306 RepID=A0ABP0BK81_9PEZI